MTYDLSYSNKFKKSLKRCFKRGLDIEKLRLAVNILVEYGKLPIEYKAHRLKGNYSGCWECHIEPDWLLVWQQDDNHLTLLMVDTGTHSDLFE